MCRFVFNQCPACDGDGEYENRGHYFIDRHTGAVSYETVRCTLCDGTGSIEEEAVLIDMDDLEEMCG